jgi:hypothetical protein
MAQLTLEKLALALIELKNENIKLKNDIEIIKDYLRKQHQLKSKK